jgi:hypothetical protein
MKGMFAFLDWSGLDWKLVVLVFSIAWLAPRLGDAWFSKIETAFSRLAAHRRLSVVVLFALPILIRLSLLPWMPLNPPYIHDEYSYLLAADTFVHGRLTNPPHLLWTYFDTFHVLQQPTYASMYPPAQGAVLAVGQLLGHPWIGVLLSVGAMCGAFLWMLQGWVPARWALLGSILVLTQFSIVSYWMNSFWGGAVAATGGALVMGTLPRVLRQQRLLDAMLLGLGAGILANSRPVEGFILCVPVGILILRRLLKQRGPLLRRLVLRVVFPTAALLIAVLSFMLYYNWRVTANPFLLPHVLNSQQTETVPMLIWQDMTRPPREYANPQFHVFYNIFVRTGIPRTWEQRKELSLDKLTWAYDFYLGPALILPFAALWPLLANPRTRFLVLQLFFCLTAALAVIWFEPHYIAPAMATLFILLVQAVRYLRTWQYAGRPVGRGLSRAVMISALMMPLLPTVMHTRFGQTPFAPLPGNWDRQRIARELEAEPGTHLVIVRYSRTHHSIHEEWVYNHADIDHAKIVWAREIPGVDLRPLLDYFNGRKIWLVEPETYPVRVRPFAESFLSKYQ